MYFEQPVVTSYSLPDHSNATERSLTKEMFSAIGEGDNPYQICDSTSARSMWSNSRDLGSFEPQCIEGSTTCKNKTVYTHRRYIQHNFFFFDFEYQNLIFFFDFFHKITFCYVFNNTNHYIMSSKYLKYIPQRITKKKVVLTTIITNTTVIPHASNLK